MRDMDTEFKILEDVAQKLGSNTAAKGQINLISEKMVCPSCTGVITQFREMYPNVQLNVFTVLE
jgi:filamentous hemagglutinin